LTRIDKARVRFLMNEQWTKLRAHTLLAFLLMWTPAALCAVGCAGGKYVWVTDLPPDDATGADYLIEAGDTLSVRVLNQEPMSTRARVRSDGKISVPLVGDVSVRGKAPAAVAMDLEARFKSFVVTPAVTVTVDEFQQPSVAVVGEVARPGVYNIEPAVGVLRALALAGGLTDYASHDSIYVLRHVGPRRVRLKYRALIDNEPRAASLRLRSGDTVVVE
jgi:polysaccharide export outer membrane protein